MATTTTTACCCLVTGFATKTTSRLRPSSSLQLLLKQRSSSSPSPSHLTTRRNNNHPAVRSLSSSSSSPFLSNTSWTKRFFVTSMAASSSADVAAAASSTTCAATTTTNPLLQDWSSRPFHLPPFGDIQVEHYEPAMMVAMEEHLMELQAIVDLPDEPTFDNVMIPLDRAGGLLDKVENVLDNMCSSQNPPELQAVQTKLSPILSRHSSHVYTNIPGLFEKIDVLYQQRFNSNVWTTEQVRLVERIHMDFVRQGANLDKSRQERLAEIKAELATLQTQFQQNVMKEENDYQLVVTKEDLIECPESLVQAAQQQAAQEKEKNPNATAEYIITLSRSLVEPFLVFCTKRALRQEAWEAWTRRGQLQDATNNIPICKRILQLRQEMAGIFGYETFAQFQCADRMAQTPEKVMELLEDVWQRAKASVDLERQALEKHVKEHNLVELMDSNGNVVIEPWDWRFVAEKVRVAQYDFDETLLKPYLSLDCVRNAMLSVSGKLFGLKYIPREDLKAQMYHPDVDVFEVRKQRSNDSGNDNDDDHDELVAIFVQDNYARPYKSSGAWMSEYRSQTKNIDDPMQGIPIVSNNNNFAKSSEATLLSYDDAETMFHEFGHAHHGMLSDATYGRLASTNVLTDFVELPSQLMEHWFSERQVLQEFAKHFQTNEPVPEILLEKSKAAEYFNQGFGTMEYTICALMDMALHHNVDDYDNLDIEAFEAKELERLGMPRGIVMRHRPAHFSHLFATEMYAAGYYVYLWAEVLDADAYAAFEETGDIFDPTVAEKARRYIYSAGNTMPPDELFRKFRGRDPDIQFMLKKKGLLTSTN